MSTHSLAPQRCSWANAPLLDDYHDKEWGVPVHDDWLLFEHLVLDGAQAGLSWLTPHSLSHVETRWGVHFVNVSALARHHARHTTVPMSRHFTFRGSALRVQCYLHTCDYAASVNISSSPSSSSISSPSDSSYTRK